MLRPPDRDAAARRCPRRAPAPTRCGAARAGAAHRAVRAGRHATARTGRTPSPSRSTASGEERPAGGAGPRRIFFPHRVARAHHPVGARRRPDDQSLTFTDDYDDYGHARRARSPSRCRAAATSGCRPRRPASRTSATRTVTTRTPGATTRPLHRRPGRPHDHLRGRATTARPAAVATCVDAVARRRGDAAVVGQTLHLLRRRRRSSACRSGSSVSTARRCAPSRWCSPTDAACAQRMPAGAGTGAALPRRRPARRLDRRTTRRVPGRLPALAGYASRRRHRRPGSRLVLRRTSGAATTCTTRPRRPRPAGRRARPVRQRAPRSTTTGSTCSGRGRPTRPGLTTSAEYDYRVLQPRQVTDANGNRTTVHFSPLGLLVSAVAVDGQGRRERRRHAAARPDGRTTCLRLRRARRAGVGAHDRRVHHATDTDVPTAERDEIIESVEYSDGFGRLLQTRTQAEDVLFGDADVRRRRAAADQDDAGHGERSPGACPPSGRPERRRQRLAGLRQQGPGGRDVTSRSSPPAWTSRPPGDAAARRSGSTIFYDPRGQAVRTVNPDGTEQLIVSASGDLADPDVSRRRRGSRSPTTPTTTPAAPTRRGRRPTEHHWNTPASAEVDALGRTVVRGRAQRRRPGRRLPPVDTRTDPLRHPGQPARRHRRARPRRRPLPLRPRRPPLADRQHRRRPCADTVLDAPGRAGRAPRRQGRADPARRTTRCAARPGCGPATMPPGR